MSFNPSQREAIRHKDGPMLVLAGPGSGKTLVITERTRHLITEYGINPANILVITFTRAAATEIFQPVALNDLTHAAHPLLLADDVLRLIVVGVL